MSEETPDTPRSEETRSVEADSTRLDVPERIGRYRILQKIGEGGMGEVYLAEQDDPRRKVALKIIKWGMDTKQVIARFEAERQALALMDHPNIARVFDAGATEHGRPYFVMEYVKGVPITEHCDTHRLTTDRRLELFAQVCEGVQHAHQKAVIHRDIKPSNVLVTLQGDVSVPKIIDFGLAKAVAQRLTERTLFTAMGVMVGTPEYMSPEQADPTAQDIDTRTDVYSLGVLLYELLVGTLPLPAEDLRAAGFEEIRRRIRDEEPSKPSTRISALGALREDSARRRNTDPKTLARKLRGDLDWITMKALDKDRSRRYVTPHELAADIQRHLQDEVVLARSPSGSYRVRKFVQRHRFRIMIWSAVGAVLLGFTSVWWFSVLGGEFRHQRYGIARDRLVRAAVSFMLPDEEHLGRVLSETLRDQVQSAALAKGMTDQQLSDTMSEFDEWMSLVDEAGTVNRLLDEGFLAFPTTEYPPEVYDSTRRWLGRVILWELGCIAARSGDRPEAIRWLQQSTEVQTIAPYPTTLQEIRGDPDLEELQGDPEFEAVVSTISRGPRGVDELDRP